MKLDTHLLFILLASQPARTPIVHPPATAASSATVTPANLLLASAQLSRTLPEVYYIFVFTSIAVVYVRY